MKCSLCLVFVFAAGLCAFNINYNISHSQFKESSDLTNSLNLVQQITDRITLNANTSFNASHSKDISRFSDSRRGNFLLSYRILDNFDLATNLSRTILLEERYGEISRDELMNTATGDIRYIPTDWLNIQMSFGKHFVEWKTASGDSMITGDDSGAVRNVSIDVNHALGSYINTSVNFLENHNYGRQTDNNRDDITGRFNYSFPGIFSGGDLSVLVGAGRQQVVYHDSSYSNNEHSYDHSITVTCPSLFPTLAMEIGTGWNWTKRFWEHEELGELDDVRNRLEQARNLTGRAYWDVLENVTLEFSFSRRFNKTDKKHVGTGTLEDLFDIWEESDNSSLIATLTYETGESRISFTRVIELNKYDTYGFWINTYPLYSDTLEDNTDRDELRETTSLTLELPVNNKLTLNGVMQAQRRETIYLQSEYSANNKISSTYSISPGFSYELGNDWKIEETLKFSADYTTFSFPEFASGNNLLFRRVTSSFSFRRVASDSTQFGITHSLRYQDQGSYEDNVFMRSEENLNNRITVYSGFHLRNNMGITPSYSYEYDRRQFLGGTIPVSEEHLHHLGISTRMKLGSGDLSLNARRTFYTDNRPSYWNATASFGYLF